MKIIQALVLGTSVIALSGGAAFAQNAGASTSEQAAQGQASKDGSIESRRSVERQNRGIERQSRGRDRDGDGRRDYGWRDRDGDGIRDGRRWQDRNGDGRWDRSPRDRGYGYGRSYGYGPGYGDGYGRGYGYDRGYGYYEGRRDNSFWGAASGLLFWPFAQFTAYDESYESPLAFEVTPRRWEEPRGWNNPNERSRSIANPARGANSGT